MIADSPRPAVADEEVGVGNDGDGVLAHVAPPSVRLTDACKPLRTTGRLDQAVPGTTKAPCAGNPLSP